MGEEKSHFYKHGLSKTRINNLYHSIKGRCYCKNNNSYKNYGARGIKICDEWLGEHGFENFAKWAYEHGYDENAPRGKCTIDRIDVNGDYSPENCRWITNKKQCSNKRNNRYIEMDGEILSFVEWCYKYNVTPTSVYYRMNKGMSFKEALEAKRRKKCKDMSEEELRIYKKKRAEQSQKWREENKDHVYQKRREWERNNIERVRASKRKYEEKKKMERLNKKSQTFLQGQENDMKCV